MSFTFLAWLTALEAYKFANKFGGLRSDAPDPAIKSDDKDKAGLLSRSDQAQAVPENDLANVDTHPGRHAKVEDTKPESSHENADLNHTLIGSSTDPQLLSEPLPSNPKTNPIAVGSPAL